MNRKNWFLALLMVAMSSLVIGQSNDNRDDCQTPVSANIEAFTSNAVGIQWAPQASTLEWEIEIGFSEFEPGTGNGVETFDYFVTHFRPVLSYRITGLLESRGYDVYIRTVCPDNQTSEWIGPLSFTTPGSSKSPVRKRK